MSTNRDDTLISHGNTLVRGKLFNMGFNERGNLVCSTYGDEVVSTRRIQDTDWHHYQCELDGTDRTVIIDGQVDTRAVSSAVGSYATNSFVMLGRRADRSNSFDGFIDEVNIFPALSTGTEQLYANPGADIAGYIPMSHLTFNDVSITQGTHILSCAGAACPVVTYPESVTSYRPTERIAVMQLQKNRALTISSSGAAAAGTDSTLLFWGRFASLDTIGQLVTQSQANRPRIAITAPGVLNYSGISYAWPSGSTAGTPQLSDWHHFAFVKSGATLAIYIDGNKVVEGSAPAGLLPFRVGTSSSLSIGFYQGSRIGELGAFE
ncbi:MAG: LamG-like jellyroll fold domain-containing protein, partial [Roseiflexaceae bacterium]